VRPDGLHLSEAGVRESADRWLFEALASAYREVVARHPAGLRAPEANAWLVSG
jgi:hypothetical protein